MEVSAAIVMSLDGKLTRHDETNVRDWASPEDQQHFRGLIAQHDTIVTGSGTYKAYKDSLLLEEDRLRVVLTSKVPDYEHESVPGQLEFSAETPKQLVSRLAGQGHKKLLMAGGPRMFSEFLQLGLINNIYATVEPRLFGQGKPIISNLPLDVKLKLLKQEQLNPHGTLLLTYEIAY